MQKLGTIIKSKFDAAGLRTYHFDLLISEILALGNERRIKIGGEV